MSSGRVNRSGLSKKLQAAAGPLTHSPTQQESTNGNPHWASDGSGHWVYEFGTRTAAVISDSIHQAIKASSVEGINLPGFAEHMTTVMSEQPDYYIANR